MTENKYYSQYLDTFDNEGKCSLLPYVTIQEMCIFLAIIIQLGYNNKDALKDN